MQNTLSLVKAGVMAVLLLGLAPLLSAQVTSAIQGRVSDPSDAVIAGATVRVTNEATGVSRTGESGAEGYYRVADLLPGKYEIRVAQAGFKTLARQSVELTSQAVLNLDLRLEVGDAAQTVAVEAEVPQVETTEARISEVVSTEQIRSLPTIGRGLMWLTMTTPGVEGKAEDSRSGNCCDSLSAFGSPALSSGSSTVKAAFFLDGVALLYGDYGSWNLAFSPNLDAVEEMRVSTNPTSAEDGILSGPQVQMVTKGGTNSFHGSGHYTFLQDSFNALPYGATRADVGSWYQRYFGGTIGGPIIKDRLFFFFAYEGLRQKSAAAAGQTVIVETKAFRDWVTQTRPNSIAAQLLSSLPPFRYATDNVVSVPGIPVPAIGTIAMDRPSTRTGNQYNGRVDYQTRSAKDRFYVSFWRTMQDQPQLDARPLLDYTEDTGATLVSVVNAHTFTPNSLNELRFSTFGQPWLWQFTKNHYNIPCVQTDDGLGFPSTFSGACSYTYENWYDRVYDIKDTFSWNHGVQSWKFGGGYRRVYETDPGYFYGDTPVYNFSTVLDFANDNPYQETRAVDAATGKQRDNFVEAGDHQLSFFAQDSWRAKPGLTLNFGLRWDYYGSYALDGLSRHRNTYGPVFTAGQLTPNGIPVIVNQKVKRVPNPDLHNFGPRISIAWDPKKDGRMVIRGGFFLLYDENNSLQLYRVYYGNPPISSLLSAGSQYGIPIVYGIAPPGTRDFPINPGLLGSAIDPALGIFTGTRPGLTGYAKNFSQPMVSDANVAFQRQLLNNLAVTVAYHFQRSTNDVYQFNANRFSGDLAVNNGQLHRLNPNYGPITTFVNWGRSRYHGLVFEVSKRMAQGWQLNASYNYHNSMSNEGGATEVFKPQVDWARDEPGTHNFKMSAVWDLPFLRGRKDLFGTVFGGWQLTSIWNFVSGAYFNPVTIAPYGQGGDFNADGQRSDRPDLPTGNVPRSYTKSQWMTGALSASIFPLPTTVRDGTLPRNYFNGPGYARIDASFAKSFPIKERLRIQFQAQASDLLNRVNISGVGNSLTSATFGQAVNFYPMRTVQLAVKCIF
jgi:outer membrane receptor protein involved in Fe transport